MKNFDWRIKTLILSSVLMWCWLPSACAVVDIDVEMRLNDGGFISFDHFKAELYMKNWGPMASDAAIFGILEALGEYFFWPSFSEEVDFEIHDIHPDESHVIFLEFDFEDIDEFIPFGPMVFWGAWFLDMETWNYDYQDFWFDSAHKWTPTPVPTSTPTAPTSTPTITPSPTPTPPFPPGDLLATDPIVGNMRFVPAGMFTQGSPDTEPCRWEGEGVQFTHILTRHLAVMETEISRQMWADLQGYQATLPNDPSQTSTSPTKSHPVQKCAWFESLLFANLLSLQNGFTQCYYKDADYTTPVTDENYATEPIYCNFNADGYRLPTEGEWEYFTRAGTSGPFSCDEPNYNDDNCEVFTPGTHPILEQYCVYRANNPGRTEVVGSKLPNPWNLKDVHGNVWEWCWDWFNNSYPTGTVTDYVGPDSGYNRVGRSGCSVSDAKGCRSGYRLQFGTSHPHNNMGFRLVRTVVF